MCTTFHTWTYNVITLNNSTSFFKFRAHFNTPITTPTRLANSMPMLRPAYFAGPKEECGAMLRNVVEHAHTPLRRTHSWLTQQLEDWSLKSSQKGWDSPVQAAWQSPEGKQHHCVSGKPWKFFFVSSLGSFRLNFPTSDKIFSLHVVWNLDAAHSFLWRWPRALPAKDTKNI